MKKKLKYYLSILIIMATLVTGCASNQSSTLESETVDTTETTISSISTSSQVIVDKEFTASDLDVGYEDSTATHITLDESAIDIDGDGATVKGSVLTINNKGTYVIAGTLTDGQVIVDANDTDKVQIVLNGVSITNSDNAAIYIKNADKVFITLKENTTNSLTDGTQYTQIDENDVDGVIFSKADLTINGDGIINIKGKYKNGIVSKDDLVITGGTFNITALKDALNGKDCVKIKDGTFNLSTTTGNGIQSKNGDDTTKGYVYVCGGTITISKSMEGIEGTAIVIDDGIIAVTAQDDGFNAASGKNDTTDGTATEDAATAIDTKVITSGIVATKEDTEVTTSDETEQKPDMPANDKGTRIPGEQRQGGFGGGGGGAFDVDANCYISISGGTITIDASGDGIDTNGNLSITGGYTCVSGPSNSGNGGLDYNGTALITGGTIVVAGSVGMVQGFSDTSSQYSLLYNLSTVSEAGTEVKLTDKEGNVVVSYTPNKQYQSVVISSPDLIKDATYTLTSGDQAADITLDSIATSNNEQGMGGQAPGGQGGLPEKEGMGKPEMFNDTETTESTESNEL